MTTLGSGSIVSCTSKGIGRGQMIYFSSFVTHKVKSDRRKKNVINISIPCDSRITRIAGIACRPYPLMYK